MMELRKIFIKLAGTHKKSSHFCARILSLHGLYIMCAIQQKKKKGED